MDRPKLTMTDTWHGYDRADAIVTIPDDQEQEHPGTWHAEICARLVDEATGDWYFRLDYNTGPSENRIGTFPASWVRRTELTDLDGIVPPAVLEQMKRAAGSGDG